MQIFQPESIKIEDPNKIILTVYQKVTLSKDYSNNFCNYHIIFMFKNH